MLRSSKLGPLLRTYRDLWACWLTHSTPSLSVNGSGRHGVPCLDTFLSTPVPGELTTGPTRLILLKSKLKLYKSQDADANYIVTFLSWTWNHFSNDFNVWQTTVINDIQSVTIWKDHLDHKASTTVNQQFTKSPNFKIFKYLNNFMVYVTSPRHH